MPSKVLDFIREQEPAFKDVPDDTLTQFIGDKYPEFFANDEFRVEHATFLQGKVESLKPQTIDVSPPLENLSPETMAWAKAFVPPKPTDQEVGIAVKEKVQKIHEKWNDIDGMYQFLAGTAGSDPLKNETAKQWKANALKNAGIGAGQTPSISEPSYVIPSPSAESIERAVPFIGKEASKRTAGILRGLAGAGSFFTSPLGVATLGIGAMPRVAQVAISSAFAADMTRQLPDVAIALNEAINRGDTEAVSELATVGVLTTVFAGKSLKHGFDIRFKSRAQTYLDEAAKMLDESVKDKGVAKALDQIAERESLRGMDPLMRVTQADPATMAAPTPELPPRFEFVRELKPEQKPIEVPKAEEPGVADPTAEAKPEPVKPPVEEPEKPGDSEALENAIGVSPGENEFDLSGNPLTENAKNAPGTLRFNLPGIGEVEVRNSRATLEKLQARMDRLAQAKPKPAEPAKEGEETFDIEAEAQKAVATYGTELEAAKALRYHLEVGEREGLGPDQMGGLAEIVDRLDPEGLTEGNAKASAVGFPQRPGAAMASLAAPQQPIQPGQLTDIGQGLLGTLERTTETSTSLKRVIGAMEDALEVMGGPVPFRKGRFNQKALGIYKPVEDVVRVKALGALGVDAHELGHAVQKQFYGSAYAGGLKGLPPAVKAELVSMGKALYGNRKPVAGYKGEGFAEFMRHWLTLEDAATVAPNMSKFFNEQVLAKNPKLAQAIGRVRREIDTWRFQGSEQRIQSLFGQEPSGWKLLSNDISEFLSSKNWIDEFDALWDLSKAMKESDPGKWAPSEDPFLLASWKRGSAPAVVNSMIDIGMQDIWGNPTGGPALRDIMSIVKGNREQFAQLLVARRALELTSGKRQKNIGISHQDAMKLYNKVTTPELELAAEKYYEWNRGLLEYVRQSNPALSETIDRILASNKNYAPLARVFDPGEESGALRSARHNPLYRLTGSERPIRDIFEATIEGAARMVTQAHRNMVLQSVVKAAKFPGLGHLVEKVPRDAVRARVDFERVRRQLEDLGIDTSGINAGDGGDLQWFELAVQPKGADPIVSVKTDAGIEWYHVDPKIYDLMNGLDVYRLPKTWWVLEALFAKPARMFRLGTTGLRPAFSLITNPVRDLQTWMAQTHTSANPATMFAEYMAAWPEVIAAAVTGKPSPFVEAFKRLGVELAQPLGQDRQPTRRAAKELFRGKAMRIVTTPIEHIRDVLSIPEAVPRIAEMKLMADEVGWTPGQPMTPDQAIQMGLAGKRATVDFTASGAMGKMANQLIPFFNPAIQGSRSFARAWRDHPGRAALTGLTMLTMPTLVNWWVNKDKDWYRNLPWRERFLYTNIEDDAGNVWRIPRPFEWGNLFQVIPEALADSFYTKDPEGATEAFKHILETTSPVGIPGPLDLLTGFFGETVPGQMADEIRENWIEFFERPIVPRSQVDLPPGQQRGFYTSKLANLLGDVFPETVSPRKVDHIIQSYLGGAVPDLMDALSLGHEKVERESEISDVPVVGKVWRRGGKFSASSKFINEYYDELGRLRPLARGKMLSPKEDAYFRTLDAYQEYYFKPAQDIASRTREIEKRQKLFQGMARTAEQILKQKPK